MLRHIFHHSGAAEGCAHFCCTRVEDFGVSYGTFDVFSHVNLHFHCGELTAIIGPNGAGKSTLLRAILGEVPHTGHIRFVDAEGRHTGRPVIGYVPQYLRLDVSAPTTVMDLFMACITARPVWLCPARRYRARATQSLARVRAEHLIDRRLGALSGGELQRVLSRSHSTPSRTCSSSMSPSRASTSADWRCSTRSSRSCAPRRISRSSSSHMTSA